MDAFLISALAVGIAEIGDRSLLVALLFGLRYRRPWPVFFGMALGLFSNQLLSAVAGHWFFALVPSHWHHWIIGVVFIVMAAWILLGDEEESTALRSNHSLFFSAALTFFILEMADKTQLTVIALVGVYQTIVPVVLGATLGILLLTTPALWLGHRFADRLPVRLIKRIACGLFLVLGAWFLLEASGVLGS